MLPTSGHVITLGATGMLSGAVEALVSRGLNVSQLSRSGSGAHGYKCDWAVSGSVGNAVRAAMSDFGPPGAALVWTHQFGQAIPLMREIATPNAPVPVFHVLGSSVSNPAAYDALRKMHVTIEMIGGLSWHPICLGFVIEEKSSRWLTHEEISSGVIEAMDAPAPLRTIGQTRPWIKRPK